MIVFGRVPHFPQRAREFITFSLLFFLGLGHVTNEGGGGGVLAFRRRVQWNSYSTPWKTLRALTKCAHSTPKNKLLLLLLHFFHILLAPAMVWEILSWSLTFQQLSAWHLTSMLSVRMKPTFPRCPCPPPPRPVYIIFVVFVLGQQKLRCEGTNIPS